MSWWWAREARGAAGAGGRRRACGRGLNTDGCVMCRRDRQRVRVPVACVHSKALGQRAWMLTRRCGGRDSGIVGSLSTCYLSISYRQAGWSFALYAGTQCRGPARGRGSTGVVVDGRLRVSVCDGGREQDSERRRGGEGGEKPKAGGELYPGPQLLRCCAGRLNTRQRAREGQSTAYAGACRMRPFAVPAAGDAPTPADASSDPTRIRSCPGSRYIYYYYYLPWHVLVCLLTASHKHPRPVPSSPVHCPYLGTSVSP